MRVNYWDKFDKENHLRPTLDRAQFDTLKGWDFGWILLEPIDISKDQDEDEVRVTTRYSSGQKALHFFWYLDAQVTNGGFIQCYLNGYGRYVPALIEGLKFIDDKKMLDLVLKADSLYLQNKVRFDKQTEKIEEEGWGTLYDDLKGFDELDKEYYKLDEMTMEIIENYAQKNPNEFGVLK